MLDVKKDLEKIKNELKIDTDDDDDAVKRAYLSAIGYVKGAIGRDKPSFYLQDDEEIQELLNTAVLMLADHYYNARSATIETNARGAGLKEYDLGFTSLIWQLKAVYQSFKEADSHEG